MMEVAKAYDEFDLMGLEEDLIQAGDMIGAKTARECGYTIANLKNALEYIASGNALNAVEFVRELLKDYERE